VTCSVCGSVTTQICTDPTCYTNSPAHHPADRFKVVDAITQAAIKLGWLPIWAESGEQLVTLTVRPRT
jgi:hypothetical protein